MAKKEFQKLRDNILNRLTELGVLPVDENDPRFIHVGSSNYSKKVIQPWTVWLDYGLNPWDADLIKRVLRTKAHEVKTPVEARIEDYEKIKHICDERIRQLKAGIPL